MEGFSGFPDGKLGVTFVPNLFFTELLPIIDHQPELKVTLYAFYALSNQEGQVRYLRLADFLTDTRFMRGLGGTPTEAAEALLDALERAVARGSLLHVVIGTADGNIDLYFSNTEKGRAAVEGISKGEWRPDLETEEIVNILVDRPNIFVLYEQNIGPLTPLIADELKDAEKSYPVRWIEEAIKLAVENNVRKWRYVLGILRRWQQEGKQDGISERDSEAKLRRQIPKEYEDLIKH
ncbi:MAG: DnaD domain protein [Ardenticatenaceae bacterium]|nr:DnaD domain protein [Ardenticatenaceae bacterium]